MYEIMDEPMEIVDLYVVPRVSRKVRKPVNVSRIVNVLLSLVCALCLMPIVLADVSDGSWPITVSLQMAAQTFTTTVAIIPTGENIVSAMFAHGTITVYNGSILSQQLPSGFIIMAQGMEFVTDQAIIVPIGNPPTYGMARVQAHALVGGAGGNISPLSINESYGTSLFLKNLTSFSGGSDQRVEHYATEQDKQSALSTARAQLNVQVKQHQGMRNGCTESSQEGDASIVMSWSCQFVSYSVPDGLHVLSAQRIGNSMKLEVRR